MYMAKVITHLCVAIRQYTDKDGKEKTQYQRIGCEMEDETGKRFLILDRFIALAGIPDFSNGKQSASVLVSKFSVKKKESAEAERCFESEEGDNVIF